MNRTLIPQLRFKEFNDEWKSENLKELNLKIIDGDRGNNYPNGDEFLNSGYCLFLNAKNVTLNGFNFHEKSFITKHKDEQLRKGKLIRNDIILTTRGTVGNIAYYNESVLFKNLRINSGMVIIRNENNQIDNCYLFRYFNSNQIKNEIIKISFGSAQPQLTVAEIYKFKIKYPSLPEQTKIANFLTVIDDKIQQLTQKKQLLEQYKKGVMQQIFSQKIRFHDDDGNHYPAWEKKKLGSICNITTGSSNREDSSLDGQYTFFDRSQDIRTSNIFLFDTEAVIVAGEGQEFIPKYFVGKFDLHQRTYAITGFDNSHGKYIYYSIYQNRNYLYSQAVGSTVKSLRLPMFTQMNIILPTLLEQTKIASFLTAIDDKITNLTAQLDQTKLFKKSLLQQMFI